MTYTGFTFFVLARRRSSQFHSASLVNILPKTRTLRGRIIMARPSSGDIRHPSIEDLLAPLPESPRLCGPGPFVINLSASTAPVSQPIKGVVGFPHAHVYQIQRTEDRRMRYRLRLGPFADEDQADAALEKVRDIYPGALTATAEADDLRALKAIQSKINVSTKINAQPKVGDPALADTARPPSVEGAQSPAAKSPDELTSLLEGKAASPVRSTVPATKLPPASIPVLSEEVLVVRPSPVISPAVPAADPPPAKQLLASSPGFESTQTVRPLTSLELKEQGQSRWFAIQLSTADQVFDPDSLPNLDIFSVYRLYSVAGLEQGRVMHALRLGFFRDQIAAAAVASYLAVFYKSAIVKRVSAAERERFADQCFEARKDVGATGKHAAIEITSDRIVRESRVAAAATPLKSVEQSSAPRTAARKSRRL
jgi:SPOR domain